MMNNTLKEITEVIKNSNKIGIFSHIAPDGDAIGSSLALYLVLKKLGKNVEVISDKYAKCFNFLTGINEVKEVGSNYDLVIALDCSTKERIFDIANCFDNTTNSISIDHHISNTYFAKYNYIEGDSPSTTKTLIKIINELGIELDKNIGECLMAGIITDSGGFRYSSVDAETFDYIALMLRLGVNVSDIYYKVLSLTTKAQFELSRIAINRLKFYSNDRVALTYITKDEYNRVNASAGDHEGIVNVGRNIEGVDVSVFLREDEKNTYKVSLRSNKDSIDVSIIAKYFNGGGHVRAAGFTCVGELDVIVDELLEKIEEIL